MIQSYINLRIDIIELIEGKGLTVLDVGCSNGVNGEYLLRTGIAKSVTGIEFDPDMAEEARSKLTQVIIGDIESLNFECIFEKSKFDLIIFGDVLEHLKNPQKVLKHFALYLNFQGKVIISVPNMQHINAIYNLAIKGYWPRNERGIFDKTHLQIFTLKNLQEMIYNSNLEVKIVKRNYRFRDRLGSKFPLRITRPIFILLFRKYFTFQYVVVAEKRNG